MQQLTKIIFERAQPKRLGSQIITGPMLATLASEYVKAINEGAVPTISTAWQVSILLRLLPSCPLSCDGHVRTLLQLCLQVITGCRV